MFSTESIVQRVSKGMLAASLCALIAGCGKEQVYLVKSDINRDGVIENIVGVRGSGRYAAYWIIGTLTEMNKREVFTHLDYERGFFAFTQMPSAIADNSANASKIIVHAGDVYWVDAKSQEIKLACTTVTYTKEKNEFNSNCK